MFQPQQAAAAGNGRTPRKGSHAVYLVTCPGWKPQRPWSWPDSFTGGRLVAKNLTGRDALGFCRAFNKNALLASQRGEPFEWAIYCRFTKARWQAPDRSIFDDCPATPPADSAIRLGRVLS